MLDEHDPAVFWFNEIKNFFNLLAAVTESVFHNFFGYMSLLIWKEYHARALDVCAFQRLDSPAKAIVKYTEAHNASSILICHVSAFVLSTATEGAGIPLILRKYRILVVEDYNISSPYLGLQIDGCNNSRSINKFYSFATDFLLQSFPHWIRSGCW